MPTLQGLLIMWQFWVGITLGLIGVGGTIIRYERKGKKKAESKYNQKEISSRKIIEMIEAKEQLERCIDAEIDKASWFEKKVVKRELKKRGILK